MRTLISALLLAFGASAATCTNASVTTATGSTQAQPFEWRSSQPLIKPPATPKDIFGVKDPSIVYHDNRYHVFMTTAGKNGWGIAYTSFANWEEAPNAPLFILDKSPIGPGYRAAPQVFYFAPQKLWYLIYQGGDPLYSTTKDINDPRSWTAPRPFYATVPDIVKDAKGQAAWLDFWNICDDKKCHLFFTDDHGSFFRAETPIERFPQGFSTPVVAMKEKREDLFEASNTYKIAGTHKYLTLVEAMRTREERCRELRLQLQVFRHRPAIDVKAVMDDLHVRLTEWRELLRSSIPEARTLLRLLIVDRLKMEPTPRGYRFSGLGTVAPILERAGLPTARFEWRPHRDSNPGFSLERAAS